MDWGLVSLLPWGKVYWGPLFLIVSAPTTDLHSFFISLAPPAARPHALAPNSPDLVRSTDMQSLAPPAHLRDCGWELQEETEDPVVVALLLGEFRPSLLALSF